jgi:hypothetical protein
VSQRHRHEYAADLSHGLSGVFGDPTEEFPRTEMAGRAAPGPDPPDFEPVHDLKDVTTPVPRVLLSTSLAGPAPSGSTDTSRLCQGCSHPPRHHPDQAALSSTSLLRQDRQ